MNNYQIVTGFLAVGNCEVGCAFLATKVPPITGSLQLHW